MKIYNLFAGFVFIFLLQSPLILAIDCKSVDSANYNACMDILNSDIPKDQKELLISNLEYKNPFFPDHDYIFDINSNKEIKSAPEGVEIYNKEFIKNTWADIFAVMPSILYNGELYAPEKTSIFTGFNYELEIPENYYSPDYPKKKNGDCKTKYYLRENEAENKIYVNGKYQGKGDFIDIFLNKDSEIKIVYTIDAEIKIKHYEWDRYCSSRNEDGSCRRYSESCEYDYTEYKNEQVKITDSINIKLYKNKLFADIQPVNSYSGITKLNLNYTDSINVNFENSEYDFNKYIYSINYSKPPYYISTLKAEDHNQEKLVNLFREDDNLIVKNVNDCKLKAFDFFNIIENNCNSESSNLDFFITTDKLKYKEDEKIKVNIFPDDIYVKISYGDQTKTAKGSSEFSADYQKNKITAEYNGLKAEKIIYVSNTERLLIIWNLIVFTLLNYFLYIILKKYSRRIK